jgi:hypothetical protein
LNHLIAIIFIRVLRHGRDLKCGYITEGDHSYALMHPTYQLVEFSVLALKLPRTKKKGHC